MDEPEKKVGWFSRTKPPLTQGEIQAKMLSTLVSINDKLTCLMFLIIGGAILLVFMVLFGGLLSF